MPPVRALTRPEPLLVDVIEHMPLGVILLDREGRVVLYNGAEEQLAGRTRDRVLGRDFFNEVAPCLAVERLAGYFQANIGRRAIDLQFDFSFALPFVPTSRDVSLRLFSIESAGHPFGCIVLEDVSRQRSIERMKETLTALILHDVRSPLTVAMMSLSSLEDAPMLTRDHRDALREGTEALARARRMLRDVLDITRLESDAMPLMRTRTDLCELARASVRATRVFAAAQQCHTVLELPADAVVADVDPDVMRRALDNLLDNAYRHSRPNQRVIVQVEHDGTSARIAGTGHSRRRARSHLRKVRARRPELSWGEPRSRAYPGQACSLRARWGRHGRVSTARRHPLRHHDSHRSDRRGRTTDPLKG